VAADSDIRRVSTTCLTAADGRRAIRALTEWARPFELAEPEFQVLCCLRWSADGLDQTTLARRLACSPAQVSATVERLRLRGSIAQHQMPGDRRRNLWQLTAEGSALLDRMFAAAGYLPRWESTENPAQTAIPQSREAAA
jgi:DNA-binding MarR family transcriptional regulator